MINTPEFKRWFRNSKVVDSSGLPLKVYHGGLHRFNKFNPKMIGKGVVGANSSGGFYFTSERENAEFYSNPISIEKERGVEYDEYDLVPYGDDHSGYYLLVGDDNVGGEFKSFDDARAFGEDFIEKYNNAEDGEVVYEDNMIYELYLSIQNPLIVNSIKDFRNAEQIAKEQGYDGIIGKDINDGSMYSDIYVVFNPTQIKATSNKGTFDPNNPDITEAKKVFGENINKKGNVVFIRKENRMINEDKENKPLNKPMSGDVKKYKVYVKDPSTGNIKKVNFGDKNMEIKRDNPERKKSFRARHKCDTAKDKTTPRYWSCKFWSDKSVTDLLNEVIEPDSIDVSKLEMKDKLCPKIWNGDKLDKEVRKVLLKNAIEFIKYSKISNKNFKDITITGSLANYNYTDTSDIDVHILIDFDEISDDKEFVGEYFRNKKKLWAENYPSKVKGHDVELYFQDTSEPHTSTGVYSLMQDKWLTKPIRKMMAIDTANVQLKSAHIMNIIDDLEGSKNNIDTVNQVDALMERLKKMRKSGLDKAGEFSTENIVFKILRNSGYLGKLNDLKKNAMSKELTLEGVQMNEGNILDVVRKYKNAGILTIGIIVAALSIGVSNDQLKQIGIDDQIINKAKQYISPDIGNDIVDFVSNKGNQ